MTENILVPKQRLTLSTDPALYSTIPPLFDLCGDNDLMSLSLAGVNPFLDWLGWQATDVYRLVREFILFTRAAKDEYGERSHGWQSDPCADPNGVESESCELVIEDFARLRRMGPVRDITKTALNYCERSPRFRIDGAQITDDREYDLNRAVEVLIQDLANMVIRGVGFPGTFHGLEHLVKTGYDCCSLDSIVIDWNENGMDGGSGATWNGDPIPSTARFVDLLVALVRRIRTRTRQVPSLAGRNYAVGDMILVLPSSFIPCLLDAYTCWSVCPADFIGNAWINAEDRAYRESLNGGMFGAGQITIEGMVIPMMPFDFRLLTGGNLFDAYLLTRGVGNRRWLYGQYNNMNLVAAKMEGDDYTALDGGRILTWHNTDHTCEERIAEMQPRLVLEAPWAQARIADITCDVIGGPLSSNPWSEYFPYQCEEDRGGNGK
jgi:hypothetical protein